jgi:TonB family protein
LNIPCYQFLIIKTYFMFLTKQRIQKAAFAFFSLCFVFTSCTNNDTTDPNDSTVTTPVVVATDTAIASVDTLAGTNAAVNVDTATARVNTTGVAKPNPAKKGMKGKVVVTAPAKSTGSMEADNTGVYSNVEYIPSFPGGNKGLQKYFDKNIQYPDDASTEGVEGVVNVSFIVDENGKLTGLRTEGQKLGYGLEEEALRVVMAMPSWTPGKLKGNNVKTKYTLPDKFQLY